MRYTSEPLHRNPSQAQEKRSDPQLEERAKRLEDDGYAVGLFWVPSQKIDSLSTVIDRLQRRAQKLGVQPIIFEKGKPYWTVVPSTVERSVEGAHGARDYVSRTRDVRSEVTPVLVAGQEPRLRGWHLVAALDYDDPTSGGEPWVRVLPGRTMPPEFRTVDPTRCDHCHTKRDRTSVFVLGHEDGRYAAVGRTCLMDFLGGHGDPKAAAASSEILFAAFEAARGMEVGEGGDYGGIVEALGLESYLSVVASMIREFGWTSRSQAYDTGRASTADLAWLPKKPDVRPEDIDLARRTIEWASKEFGEQDPSSLTDYGYSCRQVVLSGVASRRSMGVAASLVPAYQRAMTQAAERERSADSQHIGTVGERLVLDLTFTGVRTFDGQYGRTYICMFLDPSGNVVKWFASSWIFDFPFASAAGKSVKLKATIKEHGEYKGVKETQLSRAAVATEADEKPKRRSKPKAGPTTPNRAADASDAQVFEAMRVLDRDASDGDRMQINRKRGSKRTSRGSKRTSREPKRNIGPGAMGHGAGTVIDPDAVRGADGKAIDRAMDRYEVFHAKKPMEVVEVSHDPPEFVVCIGFAVSTSYRTDKWYADGQDTDYKHLHDFEDGRPYHHDLGEGVKFFENAALAAPLDVRKNGKTRIPKKYPKAWTRLGKFLGSDIRRNDGSYQEVDSNQSAKDCWLLCSPSGDMLAIYSPHPQRDGSEGFLAFMCGGKLRVIEDGIDG